ncbi:hypothetical protein DTO013E5_5902 [Penicillium roqueforti]|uniref:Genomic scaffold, ProqFM164S01 n=1 Tax=Penicillium roqueforti (strain FM164) TaxID=1365484 RepID=W6PYV6_PENRF|nr:uncharacterized protein LCP9604111_7306 [Penicillium roqueforti]CDM29200.1 unnamed protein product [Penicillium roqueforti FM164]KAF9244353.1 hypothetical protein LCP9604111_7306 [Penicillium roqueforti]KAI1835934.1 hypothetical protein CBS147337_3083 [Penicillium roqueforti]KAI2678322.1 hypothetical protein LCP963914a_7753 [Penicillium roqueforti]KAI2682956.1 hypothetical protein CBS147355_2096 [Penicillium roqueforti]
MAVRSPLSVLPYRVNAASPAYCSPRSVSMSLDGVLDGNENPRLSASEPISSLSGASANEEDGDDCDDCDDSNGEDNATELIRGSGGPSQSGLTIQTEYPNHSGNSTTSDDDEPPQSVIHAPPGFADFTSIQPTPKDTEESQSPSVGLNEQTDVINVPTRPRKFGNSPISPPPLTTSLSLDNDCTERATPRAQTRHEFEEFERRSTRSSSLQDIPEGLTSKEAEINALRAALDECWTLCNTLANLSYIHRKRLLKPQNYDMQEDAWRSCWRLCQKLYDTRDDDYASQILPTLDLCRDFCQALFEARTRDSDLSDSVLRVSFELNNHLYNTHDRNLPDAFRERTLDFYITLCHRLMKQRTRITETDSLLGACWTLAEMLFSIRQSKREGKPLDEDLLGSAVQACWELCDLFREGWTLHNLRNSDRGTPRPSQTTFSQAFHQTSQQSELDFGDDPMSQLGNPETPTTIFEDTATASPDDTPIPNILVLGYGNGHNNAHTKWSSNASSISEQSRSSDHTASSANTVTTVSEDPNLTRLKILITKAAIISGYQRGGSQNLSSFVKSLPSDAFGSAAWQTSLLKNYRKVVAFDPAFRSVGLQARVSAIDVAHACQAMLQSGQYSWLRDLYRLVFGFHIEEAMGRKGVIIQT